MFIHYSSCLSLDLYFLSIIILPPISVLLFLLYLSSDFFFFSSRRRHTRCLSYWSSDVCSSDLGGTRQSLRQRRLRSGTTKNDPGGHHFCGIRRIFIRLFARALNAQSGLRFRADRGRRFFQIGRASWRERVGMRVMG